MTSVDGVVRFNQASLFELSSLLNNIQYGSIFAGNQNERYTYEALQLHTEGCLFEEYQL